MAALLLQGAAAYRFLGFGPRSTVVTTSSWRPLITWNEEPWPSQETADDDAVRNPAWRPGSFARVESRVVHVVATGRFVAFPVAEDTQWPPPKGQP